MSEMKKTGIFGAAAAVLLLGAVFTSPKPPSSFEFNDQGELFYPNLKDPTTITSLEVTDFDEATQQRRPFKVTLQQGKWIIPTKYNHPADVKDRLAKTAAAMIDLKKDIFRSQNPGDFEQFGVNDPTEMATGTKGSGTRVTLRDSQGGPKADFIFGNAVKGKEGYRFARMPGQKRVYECKIGYEISAKFSDWVDTDLLQITKEQLRTIVQETYIVDLEARRIKDEAETTLKKAEGDKWDLDGLMYNEDLVTEAVTDITGALDELKIIDVRRKPADLMRWGAGQEIELRAEGGSLQPKGFYPVQRDVLKSTGGEVVVTTADGVIYHLWFGNVLTDADEGKDLAKDNRYLLIRTSFDEKQFPAVAEPKETKDDGSPKSDDEKKKDQEEFEKKKKERDTKVEEGRKREKTLARRFMEWYYVISAESFKKLAKKRTELVKPKEGAKPTESPVPSVGPLPPTPTPTPTPAPSPSPSASPLPTPPVPSPSPSATPIPSPSPSPK